MMARSKVVAGLLVLSTILTSVLMYPTKADAANNGIGKKLILSAQFLHIVFLFGWICRGAA